MKNFLLLLFILCFSLAHVNGQKDSAARKNIFQKVQTVINPSITKTANPFNTTTPPPDPEYIFGYCAWTDPVTGRKHLPMGHNRITGEWEYVIGYPRFTIQFVHRTQLDAFGNPVRDERIYGSQGPSIISVDATGNPTGDVQRIVAFKYRFNFNFDRTYSGNPIGDVNGTIRYNPDLWRFEEITMDEWSQPDNISFPPEDFPVIPVRWTIRTVPFPGLPNF